MAGLGKHSVKEKAAPPSVDESRDDDSTVVKMFRMLSRRLSGRHERHERLIRLSRDVTIESKKIIFLLHSATTKSSIPGVVKSAHARFKILREGALKSMAIEMRNGPSHLHTRAVTAGMQEYVEARTLCSVMESQRIITQAEVQKELEFTIKTADGNDQLIFTRLTDYDFILGVADLTGELMRRGINSITVGDSEECFEICDILRNMYTGFIGLSENTKEMERKMQVTRNNMLKVEASTYMLNMRGGEAPRTLLQECSEPKRDLEDEGFC